jgi:hypothetical protein
LVCLMLVSCLASSNLQMEIIRSSETSTDFHQTTRHSTIEHTTFHDKPCYI